MYKCSNFLQSNPSSIKQWLEGISKLCCAAGVLNAFEGNIMKSAVAGILLNNNNWTQIELTPVPMKI